MIIDPTKVYTTEAICEVPGQPDVFRLARDLRMSYKATCHWQSSTVSILDAVTRQQCCHNGGSIAQLYVILVPHGIDTIEKPCVCTHVHKHTVSYWYENAFSYLFGNVRQGILGSWLLTVLRQASNYVDRCDRRVAVAGDFVERLRSDRASLDITMLSI